MKSLELPEEFFLVLNYFIVGVFFLVIDGSSMDSVETVTDCLDLFLLERTFISF